MRLAARTGSLKVLEAAMQALGCIGIARPPLLLAPDAQAAVRSALQPAAPMQLKIRVLHNFAELLKARPASVAMPSDTLLFAKAK